MSSATFPFTLDAAPRAVLHHRLRVAALALCLVVGLLPRVASLDAAGFSEDEMDKLAAARGYRTGHFAIDGEHPALMKVAVLASLEVSGRWNDIARARQLPEVPIETAVRLPNAVAGAATGVVIFLLIELLFGPVAAAAACWFWMFDVGAIAASRVAKEDSFAVLFFLSAVLLYERGKQAGRIDPRLAQRWFGAAGAAFGLMMASKYMPYLFGIHVLFAIRAEPHPGLNRPDKPLYFGAMGAAFLVANFPLLWPGNWFTIARFLSEQAVQHTGYLFQNRLWPNAMSDSPAGIPPWFYAAAVLTKTPLLTLVAMGIGLWHLATTARTRGSRLVLTVLVLTFVPYSFVATKFLRYMLPATAMLTIAAGVGVSVLVQHLSRVSSRRGVVAYGAAVVLLAAVVQAPLLAWSQSAPHPRLYRNTLGQHLSPHALWFAPDELYDVGLREAMTLVAQRAPARARVLTEAPEVAWFYLARAGRTDLVVERPGANPVDTRDWLVVQDGRTYFENYALIQRVRSSEAAITTRVFGFPAVQVFNGSTADVTRAIRAPAEMTR